MPGPADRLQTIGLMAAHEAAMADLYRLCADRLPEHAGLFGTLAAAELDHARWLTDLVAEVEAGLARVDSHRFNPQAILSSMNYVKERMNEANISELTPLLALSWAHDLEDALIERKCFEVVETDSPELKDLLQRLSRETAEHREQIRAAWERERHRAA